MIASSGRFATSHRPPTGGELSCQSFKGVLWNGVLQRLRWLPIGAIENRYSSGNSRGRSTVSCCYFNKREQSDLCVLLGHLSQRTLGFAHLALLTARSRTGATSGHHI